MKKFYFLSLVMLITLGASAQKHVAFSTYSGTDLSKYQGQEVVISGSRYFIKGWNTLCLPFDISAADLETAVGSEIRLERLVGVETAADGAIVLNFQDCKSEGVRAGLPYILHFTGETGNKRFSQLTTLNKTDYSPIVLTDPISGQQVTMSGVQLRTDAADELYGILARDNEEAAFVNTGGVTNGFYATRCYITLGKGQQPLLRTNHIGAGDLTAIQQVVRGANERVDVYNIGGVIVGQKMSASDIQHLPAGVYVVKGKKVKVK